MGCVTFGWLTGFYPGSIIQAMKKKQKITLIILSVSLVVLLVLIVLLLLKKSDKSGNTKEPDTSPASETSSVTETTPAEVTTSDAGKTTDNEKETTSGIPTTTEKETTENPDILRDNKYNQLAINAKENGQKIVYLTFDDGSGTLTPTVLDTLDKYGVKATFFVVAEYSPSKDFAKEQYNAILAKDHTLGIHSLTHSRANIYQSLDAFKEDIDSVYNYVYELTGFKPYVSRFPGGSSTSFADERMKTEYIPYVKSKGLIYYDWNVSSGDGNGSITSEQVYNNVINGVKNKDVSVVLMHDGSGHEATVEALPRILDTLINEMNCVILPITQSTTPVQADF